MDRYSSVHRNKTKGSKMDVRFQTIVLSDKSGSKYVVSLLLQEDGLGLTSRMQPYPGAQYVGEMPPMMDTSIRSFVPENFLGDESDALAAINKAIRGVARRTGWKGIEFYRDDDGECTLSVSFHSDSDYLHYADQGDGLRLVRLHSGQPREIVKAYGWDRAGILALKPLTWLANLIKDEIAYQMWREEPEGPRPARPRLAVV